MNEFIKRVCNIPIRVIDETFKDEDYIPISISSNNKELSFDVSSSVAWEDYITTFLKNNEKKVAYGGYLEQRDIYNRSRHFSKKDKKNERNIHLGIDLWCKSETNVLAVLDGKIHSFKNNTSYGDYGPTIILKHSFNDKEFYSLYGHLTKDSLNNIQIGNIVKKGDVIGKLGSSKVNGDYAPHLHFQLIINLENNFGDYPGVCAKKDLNFYKQNCPNPNLLLKLPNEI